MRIQVDIYTKYFVAYRRSLWEAAGIIIHNRKRLEFVRVWFFSERFFDKK